MSLIERKHPIKDALYETFFPSIIFSSVVAALISVTALWKGIEDRFVSDNFLPYDISSGEASEFLYSYINPQIINTVATSAFWALMALVGIYVAFSLANIYKAVTNFLTIETEYENIGQSYGASVAKIAILRTVVAIGAKLSVVYLLRLLIPYILNMMGQNLLSAKTTGLSVGLSILWYILLVLTLEAIWNILRYSYRFIKA